MGTYTHEELVQAYQAWVDYSPIEAILQANGNYSYFLREMTYDQSKWNALRREEAWDHYCDIRDRLPLGTSRERRLKLENKTHIH